MYSRYNFTLQTTFDAVTGPMHTYILGNWCGNGTSKLVLANQITYYHIHCVFFTGDKNLTNKIFSIWYVLCVFSLDIISIFHTVALFAFVKFLTTKFVPIALQNSVPKLWNVKDIYRGICAVHQPYTTHTGWHWIRVQ